MDDYHAFNCLYEDFIIKLNEFFPYVTKLHYYRELFIEFKRADYKLPTRLFLPSVADHSLQIFNKNEQYFMNGIEITKTRERAIIETTIIKEWQNMSNEQKETVWFYLQQMLLVAMNINDFETSDDAEKKAEKVLFDALQRDKVYQK